MVNEHTHCPCNGVWLCRTCHSWVHHHPTEAKKEGWIVSQWIPKPGLVPYVRRIGTAWSTNCDGTLVPPMRD